MFFVDSHIHLAEEGLFLQAERLLQEAEEVGVEQLVVIATDETTFLRGEELVQRYPNKLFLAAAFPPHVAHEIDAKQEAWMEEKIRASSLCALGETGLEYHYFPEHKEVQKTLAKSYFSLAEKLELPVVIHCREAFLDLFSLMDAYPKVCGVLHCFTGSLEEAKGVIERGWFLSLSGIVTFKKSHELRKVAAWVPSDKLLIETDAPYLAPQSRRGKLNEPAYLVEIAQCIAEARGETLEQVAKGTANNAQELFGLPSL